MSEKPLEINEEHEELFLCKPCAEEMRSGKYKTVEEVDYVQSAKKKGTCEQCRCRRFGYICKVKFKEF